MTVACFCTDCGKTFSEEAAFCSSCGTARQSARSVDQSNNQGGTNVQAGRDVNIGNHEPWDTRPRTFMDRDHARQLWSVDAISIISGTITIASFLGSTQFSVLAIPLALAGVLFGTLAIGSFSVSNQLRIHKHHVLPLGFGTLERAEDHSTWLTHPTADCPWCPDHRPGQMHVRRTPDGPMWICENSPDHCDGFDSTQLPALTQDDA